MEEIRRLKTDILILGSGGAGLFAALHAHKAAPDLDITVAVKGLLGKSGCTRMVQGGYNVAIAEGDSVERHFQDTIEGGKWLNNQDLAWTLINTAVTRIHELENELGCFFDRNPDGTIHQKAFAGQTFDRTVHKGDLTGIEIVSRLAEQVWARNIGRLEEHHALALIKDEAGERLSGVLLVDMREAGDGTLTIRPIRTMMNHATTEIFFDDMQVPAENLIGEEGRGFRYILSGMNAERILIAAECIGDAKWFIQKASAYAAERSVFGRPIGQNQGIQFPIARAYAQMRSAELVLREAIRLYDAGENPGEEANLAKMLCAEASWAAAEMCVQTHGGFGFAEEYDVERKFREARLYQVAPISTNLILSYVGEHVLGLPRSY